MLKFVNNFKLSKKMIFSISIFLIAFFSLNFSVNAANFKYKDFDFDEFAKKNLGFWTNSCSSKYDEEDVENCTEEILESQRQFYTRLYKILAKYERKGVKFNSNTDNIIIATVFYDISVDMFTDDGIYYKQVNKTDKTAYNYDADEDIDAYDPDADDAENEAIAYYFANEKDTLKLLIKSMIGYKATCIGYKEGTFETRNIEVTDEEGNVTTKQEKFLVCDVGQPTKNILNHEVCAATVSTGLVSSWDKFATTIGSFFGIKSDGQKKCDEEALNAGFSTPGKYTSERTQSVDENYYWQFLLDGDYFDKKPHLQYYFAKVLKNAGVETMDEFYAKADDTMLSENEDEIKKARTQIVNNIKDMLHDYNGYEVNGGANVSYRDVNGHGYWWPIGSVETTVEDGKTFATGDPETSSIYRDYGTTRDDVNNEYNKNYGIEIIANETVGMTNIIAVSTGTVSEVYNSCKSNDDKKCGSGYGNYVIVLHADGNSTLYGHLHEGTITVNVGDSVSQGQVIGKMGASGKTNRTSLYFEVRTGSSKATAVNPNDYVKIDNPRPAVASSELLQMLLGLEGTGNIIGDSYQVYCNTDDVPTVGMGVTLTYHYDKFAAIGYPLSPPYTNYCGKTIPISTVNQVQAMVLEEFTNNVKMVLASAGLNLNQQQIDALTILDYNAGNINGFVDAYNSYGSTDALCSNWWTSKAINPTYASALRKRRQKECQLFVHGIYDGTYS